MNVANFFFEAQYQGISVTMQGEKLRLSPASGRTIPPALLTLAALLKPEILTSLTAQAEEMLGLEEKQFSRSSFGYQKVGPPMQWLESFEIIATGPAPSDFSYSEWKETLTAATAFMNIWAGEAYSLAWNISEVIGLHPVAPRARRDCQGIAWSLADRLNVISLDGHGADLRTVRGVNQRWWRPGYSPAEKTTTQKA